MRINACIYLQKIVTTDPYSSEQIAFIDPHETILSINVKLLMNIKKDFKNSAILLGFMSDFVICKL